MKFLYGIRYAYVDVTDKVAKHCIENGKIVLPRTDPDRAKIFGDHLPGILKHMKILDPTGNIIVAAGVAYESSMQDVVLDTSPWVKDETECIRHWYKTEGHLIADPTKRLQQIHNHLVLLHGNKADEYPEQEMAVRFIKPESVVLEIGANIGRNTCVIATILQDDSNLVTLETMPDSVKKLEDNRALNGFRFHIEPSALSKRSLIQKDWCTEVSEVVKEGFVKVNTITWTQLVQKYPLPFDTLVADCEGALTYILRDEPDMLLPFKTVILENDYGRLEDYQTVHNILKLYGFEIAYSAGNGWGPCQNFFYQVFVKP